jgi:hypothetical protein
VGLEGGMELQRECGGRTDGQIITPTMINLGSWNYSARRRLHQDHWRFTSRAKSAMFSFYLRAEL